MDNILDGVMHTRKRQTLEIIVMVMTYEPMDLHCTCTKALWYFRITVGPTYSHPMQFVFQLKVQRSPPKFCRTSLKMSLRNAQPAYSSSSSSNATFSPGYNFDIFLSFRGEDTRTKFTDHLHSALVRKGFCTFIDDKGLERGEIIDQNLLQAIEESKFFLIIFSENYANSVSCLNELVKIMECTARGRTAVPIFYHVDPSEVEKQSGKYGEAFAVYENNADLEREQIQKWRTALTKAGDRAGYHIENQ